MNLVNKIYALEAIRRSSLLIVLVFSGLGWIFHRALIAEQPSTNPIVNPDEGSVRQPTETLPSAQDTQREHAELQSDPLFQAILQQFREGRENLKTTKADDVIQVDGSSDITKPISPAQWRSIELILKAARILESEEKRIARRRSVSKPNQIPSVAKQLRSQVEQIILSANNPHPPDKK